MLSTINSKHKIKESKRVHSMTPIFEFSLYLISLVLLNAGVKFICKTHGLPILKFYYYKPGMIFTRSLKYNICQHIHLIFLCSLLFKFHLQFYLKIFRYISFSLSFSHSFSLSWSLISCSSSKLADSLHFP